MRDRFIQIRKLITKELKARKLQKKKIEVPNCLIRPKLTSSLLENVCL